MRVDLKKFTSALNLAGKATSNTLEICENVRLTAKNGEMKLSTTDIEMYISTVIPVYGSEEFDILVPYNSIKAMIGTFTKDFEIQLKRSSVYLTCGEVVHKVKFIATDEFPEPASSKGGNEYELDSLVLSVIPKALPFASADDLRRNMKGIHFQEKIAATDGFKLYTVDNESGLGKDIENGLIMPSRLCQLISGWETANITVTDSSIFASNGNTTLVVNRIDDTFPAYMSIIANDLDKEVTLHREQFINALRSVSIATDKENKRVNLNISDKVIHLQAHTGSVIKSEDKVSCRSNVQEPITVGFNYEYMLILLRAIGDERVTFKFISESKQFQVNQSGVLALVMPVRVEEAPAEAETEEVTAEQTTEATGTEQEVNSESSENTAEQTAENVQAEGETTTAKKTRKSNKKKSTSKAVAA